jgi:hypothetical protein
VTVICRAAGREFVSIRRFASAPMRMLQEYLVTHVSPTRQAQPVAHSVWPAQRAMGEGGVMVKVHVNAIPTEQGISVWSVHRDIMVSSVKHLAIGCTRAVVMAGVPRTEIVCVLRALRDHSARLVCQTDSGVIVTSPARTTAAMDTEPVIRQETVVSVMMAGVVLIARLVRWDMPTIMDLAKQHVLPMRRVEVQGVVRLMARASVFLHSIAADCTIDSDQSLNCLVQIIRLIQALFAVLWMSAMNVLKHALLRNIPSARTNFRHVSLLSANQVEHANVSGG